MKAKRISTKQVQEFINNEEERFNDQPAITDNGDSKVTSISYEGKTIKINCLLSNTKTCKWDKNHPENHNHYIVTVSYEGKGCLSIGLIVFKISVVVLLTKIEKGWWKCFICFCKTFFIKTNIRTKTTFAKKMRTRLLCGMRYASKKINIIECLKVLIFTSLQAIYKKHLIFNDLKR